MKPTRKNSWKTPFDSAEVTRFTLDILRDATEPLRSRTIAERILEMHGMDLEDRDVLERVCQTIDNGLRRKLLTGLVVSVDTWPVRWSIKDHGDRPKS